MISKLKRIVDIKVEKRAREEKKDAETCKRKNIKYGE